MVQSKFGSAFSGDTTLLSEGKKVIDTLDGQRAHLSRLSEDVVAKLGTFRQRAGELDQIRLVFATTDPLSEGQ
jgi:hypothetical protein